MAAMGAELSAEFAIFEPDDLLIDYVRERNPAPFDAAVSRRRCATTPNVATLDLDDIRAARCLSRTRCLNNSVPVSEVAGTPIDQAFIGSCANGTLDDLAIAAASSRGGRSRRACASWSRRARRQYTAQRSGRATSRLFMEAGAVVTNPTCGACFGGHMGVLGAGRDLHHRQHPQFQRAHGRSERAHLHGLAGDRRRVGDRRRIADPRRRLLCGDAWHDLRPGLEIRRQHQHRPDAAAGRAVSARGGAGKRCVLGQPARAGSTRSSLAMSSSAGSITAWDRAGRRRGRCAISASPCLLAESINGLFFRNAVNFGLLALECPGVHAAFEEGQTAEVSPEDFTVRNRETGALLKAQRVPAVLLEMMLQGGLYPHLERQGFIEPRATGD